MTAFPTETAELRAGYGAAVREAEVYVSDFDRIVTAACQSVSEEALDEAITIYQSKYHPTTFPLVIPTPSSAMILVDILRRYDEASMRATGFIHIHGRRQCWSFYEQAEATFRGLRKRIYAMSDAIRVTIERLEARLEAEAKAEMKKGLETPVEGETEDVYDPLEKGRLSSRPPHMPRALNDPGALFGSENKDESASSIIGL